MWRIALALGALALAAGPAFASPALTAAATIMRAGPSSKAAVVQAIPANAEIEVDDCGKVWCRASWRDRSGYVAVAVVAPLPVREGDAYPPPPLVVAPLYPPYAWGPGYYYGPAFGWGFGYHRRW